MLSKLPDSIHLAHLPTPMKKLARLTKYLEGPQLFIKRDDLTGIATTGNKIRKLEFLLADALGQHCDSVITCGGYQSNHARATAVAAVKLGMTCHLILRNGIGTSLEGNLFLDRLVGAEIEYITAEEYARIDDIMHERARELKAKGGNPYVIPEGGSNGVGTLGYVKAAEEIAAQTRSAKVKIDHILTPVGSGGTYAGLLLGKFLYDLPAQIHGINVCEDKAYFVQKINRILNDVQKRLDLNLPIRKGDIRIVDGYVGKGYGLSSQQEIDLIKQVAQLEGIILDPVYTGKAMLGTAHLIRQGTFKSGENLLFIHTGGIFGLFPKRALFF